MAGGEQLEKRLVEWGSEYGGARYENTGWPGKSPLLSMMTYHGPAPQGLNPGPRKDITPADEVEQAVHNLGQQEGGQLAAAVLRAEYSFPGKPVESKVGVLRGWGFPIGGRARYYEHLRIGRVHVAAWLRLPFSG